MLEAKQCEFSHTKLQIDENTGYTDSISGEENLHPGSKVVMVATKNKVHVLTMKYLLWQMVVFLTNRLQGKESSCKIRENPYNRQEIKLSNLLTPQFIGKYKAKDFMS